MSARGQSEPLGFIFAVDESYDTGFGLHDVEGAPAHTADLRPGVGDVFVDLVGLWERTGEATNEIGAAFGVEDVGVAEAALAAGAVGAAVAGGRGTQLHAATTRASGASPARPRH